MVSGGKAGRWWRGQDGRWRKRRLIGSLFGQTGIMPWSKQVGSYSSIIHPNQYHIFAHYSICSIYNIAQKIQKTLYRFIE